MPQNREYPAKNHTAGAMKRELFPGKSRDASVGGGYPKGPMARKGKPGNKPAKGVLTTGGGHG